MIHRRQKRQHCCGQSALWAFVGFITCSVIVYSIATLRFVTSSAALEDETQRKALQAAMGIEPEATPSCPPCLVEQGDQNDANTPAGLLKGPSSKESAIVYMLITAPRPGGAFYAAQSLGALQSSGIKPDDVTVLRVGQHVDFDRYWEQELQDSFSVEVVDRARSPGHQADNPLRLHSAFRRDSPRVKEAANDAPQRKNWRNNEALDFLQVSQYSLARHPKATWFVFLQDDAVCNRSKSLEQSLKERIRDSKEKGIIRLSPHGNVAIMFHRQLLEGFLGFVGLHFDTMPIDWLLEDFLAMHGIQEKSKWKYPAICKHVGKVSTFSGNGQRNQV